ncbi:hypothetical protein [Laspinema olomoucense]|uniref:hypothetical protein n=1 Tax=Laspinema olomoucense TaxID=3231600 RepID=UPI0021BB8151|nr:hypothetical protein [Laspinema sp. D3b]
MLTTLGDRYPPHFNVITALDFGDPFSYTPIHLGFVTMDIAATDGTTAEQGGAQAVILLTRGLI